MGIVQGHKGDPDLAVEAMEKAAQLDPGRAAQAFYNLGVVLTNSGQNSEAMEAFKKPSRPTRGTPTPTIRSE